MMDVTYTQIPLFPSHDIHINTTERAATVKQQENCMFPQAKIDGTESNWVPVVLRELKNTDAQYGKNTLEARFNLYGALQHSGLDVGQFVGLRGECDGETLQGCKYSLSSKPCL